MWIAIREDPAFCPLDRWIITDPDLPSRIKVANNIAIMYQDLHKMGIFHIDIKPEHIFVSVVTLQVRLIDFDHSVIRGQHNNDPWCTRPYVAPEMRTGVRIDWEKWDTFVLGLVMIFLFMGHNYIEKDIMGRYRLFNIRYYFKNCLPSLISKIEEMTKDHRCVSVRCLLQYKPSARSIIIV